MNANRQPMTDAAFEAKLEAVRMETATVVYGEFETTFRLLNEHRAALLALVETARDLIPNTTPPVSRQIAEWHTLADFCLAKMRLPEDR